MGGGGPPTRAKNQKLARRAGAGAPAAQRARHGGLRGGDEGQARFSETNFSVAENRHVPQPRIQTCFSRTTSTGWCLTRRFVSCATSSARRISTSGRSTKILTRKKSPRWSRTTTKSRFIFSSSSICTGNLQEATAHAHANGIVLKGDIAIGVYRHSADVWRRAGIVSHGHAGRRAARPVRRQGPELGLPDLQLAAHGRRRLCVVETAVRADEPIISTRSALTTSSASSASGAARRTRSRASSAILCRRFRWNRRRVRRARHRV